MNNNLPNMKTNSFLNFCRHFKFLIFFIGVVSYAETTPDGTVEGVDLGTSIEVWYDANDASTLFLGKPTQAHYL